MRFKAFVHCMAVLFLLVLPLSAWALNDADYASYMKSSPDFAAAEARLKSAYAAYLATAENAAEKETRMQEQHYWKTMLEKDVDEQFAKGSPAYIQLLADRILFRVYILDWAMNGRSGRLKSAREFYTLKYDTIPRDGIVRPEHRLDDAGSGQPAVAERNGQKPSDNADTAAAAPVTRQNAPTPVTPPAQATAAAPAASATAATNLPAGVIALSAETMDWDTAQAFCADKGGRLPLIEGKTFNGHVEGKLSWDQKAPSPPSRAEFFGPYPTGGRNSLPEMLCWTGTTAPINGDNYYNFVWGLHYIPSRDSRPDFVNFLQYGKLQADRLIALCIQ